MLISPPSGFLPLYLKNEAMARLAPCETPPRKILDGSLSSYLLISSSIKANILSEF